MSNDALLEVVAVPPVGVDNMHIGDIDGEARLRKNGIWQAHVTVVVHGTNEDPVHHAKVEASWTTAQGSDIASCRVRRDGTCKLRSSRFGSDISDVTFRVTDISLDSMTYSASENHESDGDSDGTPDCNDGCPADATKVEAGICVCGAQPAGS